MKWRRCSASVRSLVMLAIAMAAGAPAIAAPARATLIAARVDVAMQADACDVDMRLDLDLPAPGAVEHRLAVAEGLTVDGVAVTGAAAGATRDAGRTLALPITFAAAGRHSYNVRYHAALSGRRLERCPLWLPLVPTDGLSRSVSLEVIAPPGAQRLPGDFPFFVWDDMGHGRAVLSHLPAFVLVHAQAADAPVSWFDRLDTRRVVDTSAIAILAIASAIWALAQRRRRAA